MRSIVRRLSSPLLPLALFTLALPIAGCAVESGESTAVASSALENAAVVANGSEGVVFVQVDTTGWGGTKVFHECTGARIRDTWVVTAAHCVTDDGGAAYPAARFAIGTSRMALDAMATAVYVHPAYVGGASASAPAHDIALLKLASPVADGVPASFERALSGDSPSTLAGATVRCYGFGDTDVDGSNDGRLRRGELVVGGDAGAGRLSVYSGSTSTRLRQGDSGGPCFHDAYGETALVGVSSWTQLADDSGWSGVIADAGDARTWIMDTMEGARLDARVALASATTTAYRPVVATSDSNLTAVVVRGSAGDLRFKYQPYLDAPWYPTFDFDTIPLPVAPASDPAVVWVGSSLWVFVTGADTQLYAAQWLASRWDVRALGNSLDSPPAAISISEGRVDVFAVNARAHKLAHITNDHGAWSGWSNVAGPVLRAGSRPAIASTAPGYADIVVVGDDRSPRYVAYSPGAFTSCSSFGPFGGTPICITSDYSPWSNLGGLVNSDPAVLARPSAFFASATLDVIARGGDFAVWQKRLTIDSSHVVTDSPWLSDGLDTVGEDIFVRGIDGDARQIFVTRMGALYSCAARDDAACTGWTKLPNPEVWRFGGAHRDGNDTIVGTRGGGDLWKLEQ